MEKIHFIPKVEYVDGPPEISFIPVDEAIVGGFLMFLCIWFGKALFSPLIAFGGVYAYRKFKADKPKNFYQTLPYEWGVLDVKGLPSVVVDEFME